jgi:hypothetical protein
MRSVGSAFVVSMPLTPIFDITYPVSYLLSIYTWSATVAKLFAIFKVIFTRNSAFGH